MKVLFVCEGNVVRSQFAEAFYNRMAKDGSTATSAGTRGELYAGQGQLGTYAFHTVRALAEIGYDISQCRAKQLTPEMIDNAGSVIVMASSITWPEFLAESNKVTVWDVEDPNINYKEIVLARDKIKGLVEKLAGL